MAEKRLRGEIWLVDWSPGRGSEQSGLRPAVVVQTDAANQNPWYPNTIVAAVSTKGKDVPFHVALEPSSENRLRERSFVKCEQLLTIAKDRLTKRIGALGGSEMEEVDRALKVVLELDCARSTRVTHLRGT